MSASFMTLKEMEEKIGLDEKRVLLRVDFNSPIDPETGKIMDDTRIRAHIGTLQYLKDSATVILAHQSRPGKKDFLPLKEHAKVLRKHIDRPVRYIDSLFSRETLRAIEDLEAGEILLLENVRFYSEEVVLKGDMEKLSRALYVRTLAPYFHVFVNDAFAAAHRAQPSLIGFVPHLPSCAGMLMEKELTVLHDVLTSAERPSIAILGGAKADDSIRIMENMLGLGVVDRVLTTGVVANIMLMASGVDLGPPSTQFIENHIDGWREIIERAKSLLERYGEKIAVPTDVAVNCDGKRKGLRVRDLPSPCPIYDIGLDTIVQYMRVIEEAETIIMNGPAGVFEMPEFAFGTEEIFTAVARSKAFSVAGGGETSAVIKRLGLEGGINHVSTGGGATIAFLGGKHLPVEEALKKGKEWFEEGRYH